VCINQIKYLKYSIMGNMVHSDSASENMSQHNKILDCDVLEINKNYVTPPECPLEVNIFKCNEEFISLLINSENLHNDWRNIIKVLVKYDIYDAESEVFNKFHNEHKYWFYNHVLPLVMQHTIVLNPFYQLFDFVEQLSKLYNLKNIVFSIPHIIEKVKNLKLPHEETKYCYLNETNDIYVYGEGLYLLHELGIPVHTQRYWIFLRPEMKNSLHALVLFIEDEIIYGNGLNYWANFYHYFPVFIKDKCLNTELIKVFKYYTDGVHINSSKKISLVLKKIQFRFTKFILNYTIDKVFSNVKFNKIINNFFHNIKLHKIINEIKHDLKLYKIINETDYDMFKSINEFIRDMDIYKNDLYDYITNIIDDTYGSENYNNNIYDSLFKQIINNKVKNKIISVIENDEILFSYKEEFNMENYDIHKHNEIYDFQTIRHRNVNIELTDRDTCDTDNERMPLLN
jgi:hypothetical protein